MSRIKLQLPISENKPFSLLTNGLHKKPVDSLPSGDVLYKKVCALWNPKSGVRLAPESIAKILREEWDVPGIAFDLQESLNPEDGKAKVQAAVEQGADLVLVAGGDGMINTLGAELIGTQTALGVLPTGSGNGFARHFGIPLNVRRAARALRTGRRIRIDVGLAAGRPFFVTCGLAFDAELTKTFQKMPVRGMQSYIFAGIYHYFTYVPQDFRLFLDGEQLDVQRPLVLTVANLTQYGGGMTIAPGARHDDGELILVVIPQTDPIRQISQMYHLLDGSVWKVNDLIARPFKSMRVEREKPDIVQIDGELMNVEQNFYIESLPAALDVIVPQTIEDFPPETLAADV